jgi:hypothetical protein
MRILKVIRGLFRKRAAPPSLRLVVEERDREEAPRAHAGRHVQGNAILRLPSRPVRGNAA